jgi:hypothetical protein
MKRWFPLLFLSTIFLTGCDPDYNIYYKVVNHTDSEIIILGGFPENITINPGKEKVVFTGGGLNSDDYVPQDDYDSDEPLRIRDLDIIVDGKYLSDRFMTRKYWEFKNKVREATYTLKLTDELIEEIGFEEEEQTNN